MSAHAIRFDLDGTATALWTEVLPLAEFGSLEVTRASTIEFSNHLGIWEVTINDQVLHSSPSRQECLNWEHAYINGLIAKGER